MSKLLFHHTWGAHLRSIFEIGLTPMMREDDPLAAAVWFTSNPDPASLTWVEKVETHLQFTLAIEVKSLDRAHLRRYSRLMRGLLDKNKLREISRTYGGYDPDKARREWWVYFLPVPPTAFVMIGFGGEFAATEMRFSDGHGYVRADTGEWKVI